MTYHIWYTGQIWHINDGKIEICTKCILSIKFGNCSYFTLCTLTSGVLSFFSIWRYTKGIGVNWRNRNSTNAQCIIYDTCIKSVKDGIFEKFLRFCSYFEVTNPHVKNHDSPPSINRVGHLRVKSFYTYTPYYWYNKFDWLTLILCSNWICRIWFGILSLGPFCIMLSDFAYLLQFSNNIPLNHLKGLLSFTLLIIQHDQLISFCDLNACKLINKNRPVELPVSTKTLV